MAKGYTFVKEHKITYEWKIKNISSHLKYTEGDSTFLQSSEFSTGAKINDKWCIRLHLNNGINPPNPRKYTSIFLYNLTGCNVTAEVTFFWLDLKPELIFFKDFITEFKIKGNSGYPRFIKTKHLLSDELKLITNDVLTVYVEIIVSDDVITIPIESSFNSSKSQMVDDIKELYNSKANSDVTVVVGDKEFQAHKLIMMARSPVFSAMFTHEMVEKKSKQVSITDITPEIFEKVLEYIYTDEVTDLDDVAYDLLPVADKYQLLSLKNMCEHSLCSTLNSRNAVKRIILADCYRAGQLLNYVTECIVADTSNIMRADDFDELEKSCPSLGFQLLRKIVSNSNIKKSEITYSS
ncbi:speckle-type POZ protein-like [Microplitis mediator]|uniref:speckle-type POZ protein-like n=1 Tax=Microplitis mediator TaxID=375433 RepID=UPI002555B083|nr:speckle-type POZ protein-like [Microplitis mediator]